MIAPIDISQIEWKKYVCPLLLGYKIIDLNYANNIFTVHFKFNEIQFWNNEQVQFTDYYFSTNIISLTLTTATQRARDRKLNEITTTLENEICLFLDGPSAPFIKITQPDLVVFVQK